MKRNLSIEQRQSRVAYVFLILPILFYISIRLIPTIFSFLLSFTDWDIISVEKNLIGLQNYKELFHDSVFWKTLKNTFKYVIIGLPISLLLGFVLAYNIDRMKYCSGIVKVFYFMPYITSMVAIAWVWKWFFQPAPVGVFNNILSSLGLPTRQFMRSLSESRYCILAPTIWTDMGFQMIIMLAGLKGIPEMYYDVADVDGAGNWVKLTRITIPLLKQTLIFLVITGTIRYLRIFTQVMNMTNQGDGGPLNSTKPLVLYIYDNAFRQFRMGYAASLSVALFVIIMIITLIQMRVTKSEG